MAPKRRPYRVRLRGICPGTGRMVTGWTVIDATSQRMAEFIAAARWLDKAVIPKECAP